MSLPQTVTINNTDYPTTELPEAARTQLRNIQIVDREIARLQQSIAISQAARQTYVTALVEAVPTAKTAAKPAKPAAKPVEKTVKPRAKK